MSDGNAPVLGPIQRSVRDALATYPVLSGVQSPLAEMALRLGRAYDEYFEMDLAKLSRLNQELRQTLQAIAKAALDDDDDDAGDLPAPVRNSEDGSADVGSGGVGDRSAAGQAADAASG